MDVSTHCKRMAFICDRPYEHSSVATIRLYIAIIQGKLYEGVSIPAQGWWVAIVIANSLILAYMMITRHIKNVMDSNFAKLALAMMTSHLTPTLILFEDVLDWSKYFNVLRSPRDISTWKFGSCLGIVTALCELWVWIPLLLEWDDSVGHCGLNGFLDMTSAMGFYSVTLITSGFYVAVAALRRHFLALKSLVTGIAMFYNWTIGIVVWFILYNKID